MADSSVSGENLNIPLNSKVVNVVTAVNNEHSTSLLRNTLAF
jgi:hypothetical protein